MSPRGRENEQEPVDEEFEEEVEVEEPRHESVKETTRRVYEELEAKVKDPEEGEDSGSEIKDSDGDESKKVAPTLEDKALGRTRGKDGKYKKSAKVKESPTEEEIVYPPERFTVENKELFNKLPPGLRKELRKMVDAHDSQFTTKQRELSQELTEVREAQEVIRPYMKKWGLKGFTTGQAIAQLAAANDYILENREEALLWLAREGGVDLGALAAKQRGHAGVESSGDPQYKQLTDRLNALENERKENARRIQEQEETTFNEKVGKIVSDLRDIREEKDSLGRYLLPKLHDDAFLQDVTPLIVAGFKTAPNLPFRDRVIKAYAYMEGRPLSDFESRGPVKPQSRNNQSIVEQARAASSSMRSRSPQALSVETNGRVEKIPRSVKATAELAWQMLKDNS